MNAAEDRLSELMDAATRALAPPVDTILAEGERLGRRRRRRRRAAVATGTAAVVLLGGVGAVAGLRYAHVDRDDVAVGGAAAVHPASRAPTTNSAALPAISSSPVTTPSPTPTLNAPLVPITSAAAVQILRSNGLSGWQVGAYDPTNAAESSLLDFDVNDGKGVARVFVGISTVKNPGLDPADCALQAALLKGGGTRPVKAPPPSCNVQDYPNGDRVMQEVLKADPYGEYQYRIIAYRVDNVAVEITAANGDYNNVATEVTRSTPPLSIAQWTEIALNRAWQLTVPATLAFVKPSP